MAVNERSESEEREAAAKRELFAVLAHEFRSPIGAILGFEELLSDGIFGEVSEGGRDALARIRNSARQLLDLVAGLNDLAGSHDALLATPTSAEPRALLATALQALEPEAAGRNTTLRLADGASLPTITTDVERVQRALQLALMAAVKSTAGDTITVRPHARDGALVIDIEGARLEPPRDEPEQSLSSTERPRLTGAGLRIAMARHALTPVHGRLTIEATPDGTTLRLLLPPSTAD